MFAYKLKKEVMDNTMFVEGVKLSHTEWYCVQKEDIKLKNNIYVQSEAFRGYEIPNSLLEMVRNEKKDLNSKELDKKLGKKNVE
jgi:hypothetical protein